jgi:hypothetical protein
MKHPVLASAGVTALSLMGGVLIAVAIGILADHLPFHAPDQTLVLLAIIPIFGGGALWGFLLTRIHGLPNRRGASVAGALSFGLGVIGAATLLLALERALVEQPHRHAIPIHIIFTLLFVPATFLVATTGASTILLVSNNRVRWFPAALTAGVAAALSFLVVDLFLDALGFRVGAPRAAEHFTMLTVAFLGSTAAAFSAGGILGHLLSKGISTSFSVRSEESR